MNKIYCKLFGIPAIFKNGEQVFFPYAKINALVYYILINKVISRDEIAGLLWPDENEKIAKKNLRNALYQAKKSLNCEFIVSPKKSILVLNENLNITTDIDTFEKDPKNNLDLYKGDFLNGFFLKEAESYEFWITKMRNYYQDEFINTCYNKIKEDINNNHNENVEQNINRLIEIDEFDEKNFRLLMNFYQKNGRHEKVIETYYDLSKLFQSELGVDPDEETKKIYEKSLAHISANSSKDKFSDSFFYGRYEEIAEIEQYLLALKSNKPTKSILIKGEAGIGKSALKRQVLSTRFDDFRIIEAYCYQAEEHYTLRPFAIIINKLSKILKEENLEMPLLWESTISKIIPDVDKSILDTNPMENNDFLKFDLLTNAIVDALKKISATGKKVLLILEDIQWIDETSIKLLNGVMLHLNNEETIFIATSRKQYNSYVDDLITSLKRYDKIAILDLERFNKIESEQFIRKALPNEQFSDEIVENIYKETLGNSFFLSEYVNLVKSGDNKNLMTSKMMDAIKSRFIYLSENEKTLLAIVSFFYDEAPLDIISEITRFSEIDIIELLENLERRNILVEELHKDHISLLFTHSKLREYVYMKQSNSKKKILHRRIGEIIENNLDPKRSNPYSYSKLIYHFSSAGEIKKALKYKIETLNYFLNFSHELFPILNIPEVEKNEKIYISRERIQELFKNLEDCFNDLDSSNNNDMELKELEIEFHYMKGRYLIRDGKYEEGTEAIKYVISKAQEIGNRDFILEGYKQMIFYNIQTNNAENMQEYIELTLDLAVKCNYHKEIGIILRLKGLYNIMVGNYFLAEKLFNESINIFNVTEDVANRYAINIAAAYNYIGEIRFATGEYEETTEYFLKAIELSHGKNAISSLSVFYINAGKSFYVRNMLDKAKEYFQAAYNLYGQFDSFWNRPVLDSYMAITEMQLGNYETASECMINAFEFANKMKNPRDLGSVCFAEYVISEKMETNPELKKYFKNIFEHDKEFYKNSALEYLDTHRDAFEISLLNQ